MKKKSQNLGCSQVSHLGKGLGEVDERGQRKAGGFNGAVERRRILGATINEKDGGKEGKRVGGLRGRKKLPERPS